jgi:hypothetical protein
MWAKQALHRVRSRAALKGIEYDASLVAEDLLPLPEICPLLGLRLDYSTGGKGKGGAVPNSASVDRIDNSKGYVRGNIWIISRRANSIKSDASAQELRTLAPCLTTALKVHNRHGFAWKTDGISVSQKSDHSMQNSGSKGLV